MMDGGMVMVLITMMKITMIIIIMLMHDDDGVAWWTFKIENNIYSKGPGHAIPAISLS